MDLRPPLFPVRPAEYLLLDGPPVDHGHLAGWIFPDDLFRVGPGLPVPVSPAPVYADPGGAEVSPSPDAVPAGPGCRYPGGNPLLPLRGKRAGAAVLLPDRLFPQPYLAGDHRHPHRHRQRAGPVLVSEAPDRRCGKTLDCPGRLCRGADVIRHVDHRRRGPAVHLPVLSLLLPVQPVRPVPGVLHPQILRTHGKGRAHRG